MAYSFTKTAYYSPDRPHISQSMIKDFLKSPRLYVGRHVTRTLPRKETPAMRMGKFFDALLTEPHEAAKYYARPPRKTDPSPFALSESEFEETALKAAEVKNQAFWKKTRRTKFQVPLEAALLEDFSLVKVSEVGDRPHVLICGLLDRLDSCRGEYFIQDIKSVNPNAITSPRRWYYTCLDWGYDIQFAVYSALVRANFDDVLRVRCGHICATFEDGLPYVALFGFPQKDIHNVDMLWREAAWKIKRGEFKEEKLSWATAPVCGPSFEETSL